MIDKQLPLRPNTCMIVYNAEGLILLAERYGEPGIWQFPQGGVEQGCSLEENVYKELEEELGAPKELFQITRQLTGTHQYEFVNPPAYAKDRWRGQSQTFWLVKFIGSNRDLNLATEQPEFMNYQWCPVDQVIERAEPRRRPGYLKVWPEVIRVVGEQCEKDRSERLDRAGLGPD